MKKITILIAFILLSGCVKHAVITDLNPQIIRQPSGIYSQAISAAVTAQDLRKDNATVIFELPGKPAQRLENLDAPHLMISEALADGLVGQGLLVKGNPEVLVTLYIDTLLARVTKAKGLYTANAESRIRLTVNNRDTTLTKTYDRQATKSWALRPEVAKLEDMLNSQLSDIINQILNDDQMRSVIRTSEG